MSSFFLFLAVAAAAAAALSLVRATGRTILVGIKQSHTRIQTEGFSKVDMESWTCTGWLDTLFFGAKQNPHFSNCDSRNEDSPMSNLNPRNIDDGSEEQLDSVVTSRYYIIADKTFDEGSLHLDGHVLGFIDLFLPGDNYARLCPKLP